MMTEREDLTNRILALRGLKQLVEAEEKALKVEAARLFTKVGTVEPGELNGVGMGKVSLIKGDTSWTVQDPAAFLRWVETNRPGEIVTERSVRSSFTAAVLAQLGREEALVDEPTGELVVPPGVVPKRGEPSVRVSPSKEAAGAVLGVLGDVAVVLGLAHRGEIER